MSAEDDVDIISRNLLEMNLMAENLRLKERIKELESILEACTLLKDLAISELRECTKTSENQ